MTDRIDHFAEARRLMSAVTTRDWAEESPYVDRRTAAAQVHATLALVEQQRIASLLAYRADFYYEQQQNLLARHPDIAAALGIETGAGDD